ncbi:hypothetical protein PHYBLDRAFT_59230 [Phycomyces blakesleeanus NRRL 1555(-)]|uniref:MULE transposase domain-containing protein n=1 Tax=Phycomyces blakesleeanus (strain ATCC 8743b / DSM 1359 / FGSC 10004 / NBRC 33097 / NRRL 1555) TaxID=763407 RepID=A0A162Q576_PHYB8|nr:hypothetical protein PHYBLDRAFT_59230 [Phycomyces blakesleeanus NRRL 1555(-)]OAD80196.1 hypothetical protein PHYBLDRAFT_59230 [Phycomyces blakesleeanus NRRL 1555(-)]|eukprot:XP_018298236.1 hypothetical protein PHYBLDRAFT_59230 [Phycomyces blakesleeanus NRRL 1555(-)]
MSKMVLIFVFLELIQTLAFENKQFITLFVTYKCSALMNALDTIFSENKKLLCYSHMLNSVKKAFSEKTNFIAKKKELMNYVSRTIHSRTKMKFNLALLKINNACTRLEIDDNKARALA